MSGHTIIIQHNTINRHWRVCVFCYLAWVMCDKPTECFVYSLILPTICPHSPFPHFLLPATFTNDQKTRTHTHPHTKSWVTFGVKWFILIVFLLLPPFSCPLLPPSPISRAVVEKYLLEKSRLVSREKNERWVETGRVLTLHPHWPSWGPLCKHENVWIWSSVEGFRRKMLTLHPSGQTLTHLYTWIL